MMDREALVLRNRAMADAYHTTPPKHYIRRVLLKMMAHVPITPLRPSNQERILLMRPDHIGDVLLATPAFHALRQAMPHAEIHALIGHWSASVLANNPDLDAVLTVDFPGFNRAGNENIRSPYRLAYQVSRQLRRVGYTHAVIMRPDHWWGALVAFMAGISVRIGYDLEDVSPFLTSRIAFQHEHVVMQNVRLLKRWVGDMTADDVVYQYPITDKDRQFIQNYLQTREVRVDEPIGGRYFCIHAGSGASVKQWGIEQWAMVADTLAGQLNATPILTGGDHERGLVQAIVDRMETGACVTVGDTDINQLAALFEGALVVLGPDSGPLHLAAAVQTPTVALFGAADPVEFGQWGAKNRHAILTTDIGCRPCRVLDWGGDDLANHPCVREITVGRVLDAARRVLYVD